MGCTSHEVTPVRVSGGWRVRIGRLEVVGRSKEGAQRAADLLRTDEAVPEGLLGERRRIVAALEGVDVPTHLGLGVAVQSLVEDLGGATAGLRTLSGRATVALRIARIVRERIDELAPDLADRLAPELLRLSAPEVVEGCPLGGRIRRLVDGIVASATRAGACAERLVQALGTDEEPAHGKALGEASVETDRLRAKLSELLGGG